MRVVLASESQSRKRALDILGLAYEVRPSAIDEKSIRDTDPAALTKKLAEAKAWKVASEVQDAVVVSGDAWSRMMEKFLISREAWKKRWNFSVNFLGARSSLLRRSQ
jgi:predicted house-cleaning NTP pyrophosphatase (Maf/HAM1 superfamily)